MSDQVALDELPVAAAAGATAWDFTAVDELDEGRGVHTKEGRGLLRQQEFWRGLVGHFMSRKYVHFSASSATTTARPVQQMSRMAASLMLLPSAAGR